MTKIHKKYKPSWSGVPKTNICKLNTDTFNILTIIMPLYKYYCKWYNVTIVLKARGGVTYMGVARKMMHSHSIMYIIWPLSRMWFPSSSSDDSLSKLRPPSWSKKEYLSHPHSHLNTSVTSSKLVHVYWLIPLFLPKKTPNSWLSL